ncbi:MAG TPA: DUF1015 domain-containing protein [Armatimonadota bacterium]|nr:DUF1015 domain-containing protein [Armatimonadota bacterium]
MAEIRGFNGVRYGLADAREAEQVIAPPYDVISPAEQQALWERSPHNIVRLELPKSEPSDSAENNRYTRAAQLYRDWLAAGVLRHDAEPCLYIYGQRYQVGDHSQERLGLLAALKVEPYEAGVVLPHEQTFPKHKEDRFQLLRTARAQFSPIFGLYSAPEVDVRVALAERTAEAPAAVATDPEGVEHRLWPVSDPAFAQWATEAFAGRQVFIADGHHRYETAVRYAAERGASEGGAGQFDHVMAFLVEMDDPGLVLLPTHRLVRGPLPPPEELSGLLQPYFRIERVTLDEADALEHHQIGIVLPDGAAWRLTLTDEGALDRLDQEHSPAWRDLDVALLHRLVFSEVLQVGADHEVVYTRDPAEARSRVLNAEFDASFLLPSPRVEELKLVAAAGDRMPEKSTYFWPKAISGLVIYGE